MNGGDKVLAPQDKKLFDFMNDEYKNIINQFALAVFGIGALFFAAGQMSTTPRIKQLIDLIGFGASVTMWIHMHGAYTQIEAIRKKNRRIKSSVHATIRRDQLMATQGNQSCLLLSSNEVDDLLYGVSRTCLAGASP